MRLSISLALIAAALVGCATSEPFSYIQGERWLKAELNTFDVTVISVGEKDYIQRGYDQPIRIDPGVQQVVVQGPPVGGFRHGAQRSFTLDVKPCTRYWLEARKTNSLAQDFEPRVNYAEPIAGCRVDPAKR